MDNSVDVIAAVRTLAIKIQLSGQRIAYFERLQKECGINIPLKIPLHSNVHWGTADGMLGCSYQLRQISTDTKPPHLMLTKLFSQSIFSYALLTSCLDLSPPFAGLMNMSNISHGRCFHSLHQTETVSSSHISLLLMPTHYNITFSSTLFQLSGMQSQLLRSSKVHGKPNLAHQSFYSIRM